MQTQEINKLKIRFVDSMAGIDARQWNSLAQAAGPFLRHEFLLAMEKSGSASLRTGWQAQHLLVEDDQQKLVAAMPLYLKMHSYGEYVFDWAWADAYRRNGLAYYPKMLTAIPFTPSSGQRILVSADYSEAEIITRVLEGVIERAEELQVSSWHVLFPLERQSALFQKLGMTRRKATQFQWFNRGYESFDHFLEQFNSRKRKNLKKERRHVSEQGISFRRYAGKEITESMWDQFYLFYQSTYHVRGQQGYLSREFFSMVADEMPDNLLLIIAEREGEHIAGALSFLDSDTLYGRYWGCLQEYEFLHFETCYYQGIDFCIANRLRRFDSGAQGEHKIQRGFEPVETWSNHWIADPRFREAIADFIESEVAYVDAYRSDAASLLPFRKAEE